MEDIAAALTNSLSRNGEGGMLAPFGFVDGTVTIPGAGFSNEPNSGLYRAGTGDLRMSVLGKDKMRWVDPGGSGLWNPTTSQWDSLNDAVMHHPNGLTVDLNTLTATGIYSILGGSTNQPYANAQGSLFTQGFDATNAVQKFSVIGADGSLTYVRILSGIGWTPWVLQIGQRTTFLTGIDLNSVRISGIYSADQTCTNIPMAGAWGHLFVKNVDGNQCCQEFTVMFTNDFVKFGRELNSGSWGPWFRILAHSLALVSGDLNSFLSDGLYSIATTSTNQPVAGSTGYLNVQTMPNGDTHQEFIQAGTGQFGRWERVRTLNTWFAWTRILSSAGSIGYSVGGAITQVGAPTNGVTLNTLSGVITMVSAAWTTNEQKQFVLSNTLLNGSFRMVMAYSLDGRFSAVSASHAAGQARIKVTNDGAGNATLAPAIAFALIDWSPS
jgi:hypothetical protein